MASGGNWEELRPGGFPETHWSLVLAAVQADSPKAREAMACLCEIYWYPIYAYIRRRGYPSEDAKDLTQELFARLIEYRRLEFANESRGRFRSFLLTCVQHFLTNEWKKGQALKRGGNCSFIHIDEKEGEKRYWAEPADPMSPEKLFDRRWVLMILDQTLAQLRQEFERKGKAAHFDVLQEFLSGAKGISESYAKASEVLGLSEAATRQAAYRMRLRWAELLRTQVAQTVANPAEFEAEWEHFRAVFRE